eukprot:RCo037858
MAAAHRAETGSPKPSLPPVPDQAFNALYSLQEQLGKGSYAVVHRCIKRDSSRAQFAVKVVDKTKAKGSTLESLTTETAIMKQIQHRHIVSLADVLNTSTTLYIVLELLRGGDLLMMVTKLTSYSESTAACLMGKMLNALNYLHNKGICHRDLKPDNLLLTRPITSLKIDPQIHKEWLTDIKVADFGFATTCSDDNTLTKCCGTPYYIAPEILNHGVYKSGPPYGKQCDMWSAGVIAYVLLCGFPPFNGKDRSELFRRIVRGDVKFPPDTAWGRVSDEAKSFVRALLEVNPSKRLTAETAMQHPWVQAELVFSGDGCGSPLTPRSALNRSSSRASLPPLPEVQKRLRGLRGEAGAVKAAVFGIEAAQRMEYLAFCKEHGQKPNSGLVADMEARAGEVEPEELNLSQNYFGKKGMAAVMVAVAAKRTLKKLVLQANEIDNTSVDLLVDTLARHPSVTHIDLSQNPLSRTGAKKLQELVRRNPNLLQIDLHGTQIHADRVELINRMLSR